MRGSFKSGSVGIRFAVRIRVRNGDEAPQDLPLEGAAPDGLELEFRKPNGLIVTVVGKKDDKSNEIFWISDSASFLDETGSWSLSGNVRYTDGRYIKAAGSKSFYVER